MPRGNPYPHRYKFGKIKKPIDFDIFLKLQERVKNVDRSGYSVEFIQALMALLYWTGLRITEVLGRKEIKYKTKDGIKIGPPHPGLVKEDMKIVGNALYVYCVGEKVLKHGKREAPLVLPLELPFVDLIVKQWRKTEPGKKIFPITKITFWRICKRIDPKFTPHFFRHNRITFLSADEEASLAEICSWTGLSPQTVADYMMRVGRFTKKTGFRILEKLNRQR